MSFETLAASLLSMLVCMLLYISSDILRALGNKQAASRHISLSLVFGLLAIAILAYEKYS